MSDLNMAVNTHAVPQRAFLTRSWFTLLQVGRALVISSFLIVYIDLQTATAEAISMRFQHSKYFQPKILLATVRGFAACFNSLTTSLWISGEQTEAIHVNSAVSTTRLPLFQLLLILKMIHFSLQISVN